MCICGDINNFSIIYLVVYTVSQKKRGATFLNFYVSHSSATRFLRNGEKYYIYFIQFTAVCNSERIFKIGEQMIKLSQKVPHDVFSETRCIYMRVQWHGTV